MRKAFIVLLVYFFSIFSFKNLVYSNPYPPNSQAWHNYNGAIWAEQDRQREIERQNLIRLQQQQQQKKNEPNYSRWSVFVYNENTADYFYHVDLWIVGNYKAAVKEVQKEFREYHKAESDKYIYWEGPFRGIVAFGKNRENGKWKTYFMYGASESNKEDLMRQCEAESDHCSLIID